MAERLTREHVAERAIIHEAPALRAPTKVDRSFELPGLPPGEYKLEVWHEKLGKEKGTAIVKDDGSSEMVEIKLGESKKKARR